MIKTLDATAKKMGRPRTEIIRRAIEQYLEDYADLSDAMERLRDPSDPVLDWESVKRELLAEN